MSNINEIWKSVDTVPGYEVSNFGRVRSIERYVKNKNGYRLLSGSILKPIPAFDGYLSIQMRYKCKKTCVLIHRLVATHFIENINNMPIINHIDGDKKNNRVENLEWTNKSGNAYHAISMGRWNMKNKL